MAAGVATGGVAALAGGAAYGLYQGGAGCYRATAETQPRAQAASSKTCER